MMAKGEYSIVLPNGDNRKYLTNGWELPFYKLGDLDSKIKSIERLILDECL